MKSLTFLHHCLARLSALKNSKRIEGSQGVNYILQVDSTWIIYNKPKSNDLTNEYAGFLMALGLNGHLVNLHTLNVHDYLSKVSKAIRNTRHFLFAQRKTSGARSGENLTRFLNYCRTFSLFLASNL